LNDVEELLKADAARRQAMISANADDLADALSDDLVWTHSSGRTEGKAAIIQAIESQTVQYLALEVEDVEISQHNDIFICHGTLNGRASRDGVAKELRNKFLSVWQLTGSSYKMLAWQSTGF